LLPLSVTWVTIMSRNIILPSLCSNKKESDIQNLTCFWVGKCYLLTLSWQGFCWFLGEWQCK
jgi:hypothetical protein